MTASDRDPGSQAGFVAALEALAFGVLIFVIGTLVVVNAWAAVDAKFAANAAAREAVRAAVETVPGEDQAARADAAARQALAGHGITADPAIVPLALGLERCQEIAFEVRLEVPALLLPGIATRRAPFTVVGAHREIVDPFRSGLAVPAEGIPDCGL